MEVGKIEQLTNNIGNGTYGKLKSSRKDNINLQLGIEFSKESLQQLELVLNMVKELNIEIEKLSSNESLGHVNQITINTSAFMGDEQDAKYFAELLTQYINEDIKRK